VPFLFLGSQVLFFVHSSVLKQLPWLENASVIGMNITEAEDKEIEKWIL
jgi:hypothetical protein